MSREINNSVNMLTLHMQVLKRQQVIQMKPGKKAGSARKSRTIKLFTWIDKLGSEKVAAEDVVHELEQHLDCGDTRLGDKMAWNQDETNSKSLENQQVCELKWWRRYQINYTVCTQTPNFFLNAKAMRHSLARRSTERETHTDEATKKRILILFDHTNSKTIIFRKWSRS